MARKHRRRRSSASCVRRRSYWHRAGLWRMRAVEPLNVGGALRRKMQVAL